MPGIGVSVAAVLSDLECQPGEFITGPWVRERVTLVAEQGHRVVAAAHLLRYFADERAGAAFRGSSEIRWLVFWPEAPAGNPHWPDATQAAELLIGACLRQLEQWGVTRQDADGDLPVPGVYGVPEQWPHVRALYERAGFRPQGHTEVVHLARIEDLPGQTIGYLEVDTLQEGQRLTRHGGWANVGNLGVAEPYRRRGVATWLLGQAAAWLELADVDRLLDYTSYEDPDQPDGTGYRALLAASGFTELTRTQRVWTRAPQDQ